MTTNLHYSTTRCGLTACQRDADKSRRIHMPSGSSAFTRSKISIYEIDPSNFEACPAIGSRSTLDLPVVGCNNPLDDTQSESSPVLRGGIPNFEHPRAVVFRNSRLVVFNIKPIVQFSDRHSHVLATVLDRVTISILEQLF